MSAVLIAVTLPILMTICTCSVCIRVAREWLSVCEGHILQLRQLEQLQSTKQNLH